MYNNNKKKHHSRVIFTELWWDKLLECWLFKHAFEDCEVATVKLLWPNASFVIDRWLLAIVATVVVRVMYDRSSCLQSFDPGACPERGSGGLSTPLAYLTLLKYYLSVSSYYFLLLSLFDDSVYKIILVLCQRKDEALKHLHCWSWSYSRLYIVGQSPTFANSAQLAACKTTPHSHWACAWAPLYLDF